MKIIPFTPLLLPGRGGREGVAEFVDGVADLADERAVILAVPRARAGGETAVPVTTAASPPGVVMVQVAASCTLLPSERTSSQRWICTVMTLPAPAGPMRARSNWVMAASSDSAQRTSSV